VLEEFLPEFSGPGWQWVEVMERVSQPNRIILIAHADCRWYLTMGFATDGCGLRERQVADLQTARAKLTERFQTDVELYYARMEGEQVLFETL
jgi:hypothetical protein